MDEMANFLKTAKEQANARSKEAEDSALIIEGLGRELEQKSRDVQEIKSRCEYIIATKVATISSLARELERLRFEN